MNKRVLLFLFYFYACYQSVPLKFKKHDQNDFIKNKNFLKQSFVDSFNREFENEINLENVKGNSGIVYCSVCEVLLSSIRLMLKHHLPTDTITEYVVKICGKLYVEEVCRGTVKMFKKELFTVVLASTLTSSEMCQVLTTQNCSGHEIQALKWILDIPPKNNSARENNIEGKWSGVKSIGGYNDGGNSTIGGDRGMEEVRDSGEDNSGEDNSSNSDNISVNDSGFKGSEKSNNPPNPKPFHILHLSDIHLDLDYIPSSNADCQEPLCCRQGYPEDPKAGAGYWGDYRHCDLPLWTLQDAFEKISQQHHYDHILWTGDTISHNLWKQSIEEQINVLNLIMQLFNRYFPGIPVYSSLGNHESIPVNSFPTTSTNDSVAWLYETVYNLWSPWLPADAKETVLKGGFYTAKVSNTNLWIVSLNMNFCNNLNGWLLLNATDPYGQLAWFVEVLLKAEADGEKVHVIGHIPPGAPECIKWWSYNYNNIVRRFHETLVGQFFGHRHFDSFEIFYEDYEENNKVLSRAVAVGYLSPSLTTFIDNNPAYRVYDIDPLSWTVTDHRTYIMDLESSNLNNQTNWTMEYSAKAGYGMADLSAQSYDKLVTRMVNEEKLFEKYFKYYFKSHPGDRTCDRACRQMMLCSVLTSQSYDFHHCLRIIYGVMAESEVSKEKWQEKYLEWASEQDIC